MIMKAGRIVRLSLAVLAVFISTVSLLQAEVITFDPPLQPGGVTRMDDWFEQGMRFTGPNGFSQYDSGRSRAPDNGSAYLRFAKGPAQTLTFKYVDSTPFTLVSVDLAEYSTFFAEAKTIRFDCHKTDGTVQTGNFTVDGSIDGPGGILDFETFAFGPEFTEISYVEVPTTTYSMDNVVSVQLPGYETLIGLEIKGPNNVEETTSGNYDAIAFFGSGKTLNVTLAATWSLNHNAHASIGDGGLLRTEDMNAPEDVTIYAKYSKGDVTLEAEILVRISLHTPRTFTVPEQYHTIQAAINQSLIGDEIVVHPGRYYENINLDGKRITLRSKEPTDPNIVASTIIDGTFNGSVVTFTGEELPDCVLSGFTITNGKGTYGCGGGILGNGTNATIQNNIISKNSALSSSGFGGGLYDCDGIIQYNVISENHTSCNEGVSQGGGLYGCDGTIQHNTISYNSVGGLAWGPVCGGGLCECNGTIQNNTIIENTAPSGGGLANCTGPIRNCIIWGNNGGQIYGTGTDVCYSDIEGDYVGIGNIDSNPYFADPNYGDYHLKSQAGRWDTNEGRWTIDEVTSPCIDAGDPMSPIGQEPFPNGGRINMGTYGGTAEASKSYFGKPVCEVIVAGDINGDCIVDFRDFLFIALHWCEGTIR